MPSITLQDKQLVADLPHDSSYTAEYLRSKGISGRKLKQLVDAGFLSARTDYYIKGPKAA